MFPPLPSKLRILNASIGICVAIFTVTLVVHADSQKSAADYVADPTAMLEAYRHVEVASVSDAMEQLLHQRRYMSHRMQANFPTKFAGTALTVKLVKEENNDPE